MFFSFYKAKFACPKNRALLGDFARPSAPDRHRVADLPRSVSRKENKKFSEEALAVVHCNSLISCIMIT